MSLSATPVAAIVGQRAEVILVAAAICVLIIELVRRKHLMERYAILWLLAGVVLLLLAFWQGLLTTLAHAAGIYYPPAALFAVAFLFVLIMLLHFSIAVSRLSDQNKILAQRLALLQQELRARAGRGARRRAAKQQTPVASMMRPGKCPICSGRLRPTGVRARDYLVTGEGPFAVLECAACEYGVTDPQLSNDELGPYYDAVGYYESYYEHGGAAAPSPLHRLRARYRRYSAERRNSGPPYELDELSPGRVLDVGCGAGELLEHFAQRGWEIYGLDPSAAAVQAAAQRGASVHQGTLSDQPWEPASFQMVTFNHALEHIGEPIETLRAARELLAPGGHLAIAVPNWACWQRRYLFRNHWSALDLPRHQQHFSPRALERIAALLDLELAACGTISTTASTAYSIHYLIAGRWSPGWKLWLSYGLSMPLLPFVFLGDRFGGGDACYAAMQRPPD